MKSYFVPLGLMLPVVFTLGAVDAYAMTLGNVRGGAILGQALEVTVGAQFATEEESGPNCFKADVFYGDAQQESTTVEVTAPVAVGSGLQLVRIQAKNKVDEPVVTVHLRVTCGQQNMRKYVLLADLPVEPNRTAELPKNTDVHTADITTRAKLGVSKAQPRAAVSNRMGVQRDVESTIRPRLKLEPLEVLPDRDPILKSTAEIAFAPVEDLQKRLQAAALWRALNASAQEVLRDDVKRRALEGDMKSLTDASAKQRRSLDELQMQLAESEAARFANPLVFSLIAALLAGITGAVLVWTKRSKFGDRAPWWRGKLDEESLFESGSEKALFSEGKLDGDRPGGLEGDLRASSSSKIERLTSVKSVDIALELGETTDTSKASALSSFGPRSVDERESEFSSFSRRDFGLSLSGAIRYVNTKEMLDVRQQAEFFMALGRHDEAIAVLESGVARTADANPLIYLDLLKLFNTLSRKSDFDLCRQKFNQLFTCLVPTYTNFHMGGNSLDAYPQVCAEIANLWPTSQAIEYIEFCLVRTPADSPEQGFDMEAYRDLLLLDSIAKQLVAPNVTTIAPFSAGVDRFTLEDSSASTVKLTQPLGATEDVDLDLSDSNENLIDFDISHYENTAIVKSLGGLDPNVKAAVIDEPAERQG